MGIRQKIIRGIFRWSQALLDPPPAGSYEHKIIGTYEHVPGPELQIACAKLYQYQEIELSTVTHQLNQPNQYTCVLLVGRKKHG